MSKCCPRPTENKLGRGQTWISGFFQKFHRWVWLRTVHSKTFFSVILDSFSFTFLSIHYRIIRIVQIIVHFKDSGLSRYLVFINRKVLKIWFENDMLFSKNIFSSLSLILLLKKKSHYHLSLLRIFSVKHHAGSFHSISHSIFTFILQ